MVMGNVGARGTQRPKDGWQQSGNIVFGDDTQTVTMQADFTRGAGAGDWTVQFNVSPGKLAGKPINPVATIRWSVEGNTIIRKVSVGDGTSVTGTAQALRVIIQDEAGVRGDKTPYGVGVQVARGARPTVNQPATLTAYSQTGLNPYIFTAPSGGFVDIPIPQNAGVISVFLTFAADPFAAIPFGAAMIQQLQGGVVVKEWDAKRDPDQWVPIIAGADTLRVRDVAVGGAPTSIDWTAVWGIDG